MRVARLTVARRCPRVALVAFVTVGLSVASCSLIQPDQRAAVADRAPVQSADPWYAAGRAAVDRADGLRADKRQARSLVLFVGDGMGMTTVTAARILAGQRLGLAGEEHRLAWEDFPHVALTKTYNTNQQVPDSAGTATALLSGVKTMARVIGVDSGVVRGDCASQAGHETESLFDLAEAAGMATGVVTTTRLTHATPAAAYAHSVERYWEVDSRMPEEALDTGCVDVARQLVAFGAGDGLDVALGGGRRNFLSDDGKGVGTLACRKALERVADGQAGSCRGKREDGRDLVAAWVDGSDGRRAVFTANGLRAAGNGPGLLGLFADSHLPYAVDQRHAGIDLADPAAPADKEAAVPSLALMTVRALDVLAKSDAGFVLLVEGGRIDHGHHRGQAGRALEETLEFDRAVRAVLERVDDRTLVVVTADHDHGLAFSGLATRGNPILGPVVINKLDGTSREQADMAADGRAYTALTYAGGKGAIVEGGEGVCRAGPGDSGPGDAGSGDAGEGCGAPGMRPDLLQQDWASADYRQQALVPMMDLPYDGERYVMEMHGGADIAAWARGPGAWRLQGTVEQNVVFHVMARALGLAD